MVNPNKYLNEYIEVKESSVHGKGLFARKDIPVDTFICIIQGEFINEVECIRREEDENNNYIFWHSENNYIDVSKNLLRYLNHDCSPKCYVDERDETSLCLITESHIFTGEEITIDYEYDEIYDNCNCDNCQSKIENQN
jgi:SET domain-containing protein